MAKLTLTDQEMILVKCLRETGFDVKILLETVKENMGKTHATLVKKIANEKDNFLVQILQEAENKYENNYLIVSKYVEELEPKQE